MSAIARYCAHCGGAIELRTSEGRTREVCASCGAVFYRNPLPVAASVVVNERREILLVKRKHPPEQGRWCLPIGFAELDETIEEAALRELQEEAGVEGRVRGLLDADSYLSDFYGDLLIVTFDIERTGGLERPGDDAEAVGYFPLDGLPPLAFSSNDKAVAAFRQAHEEEWGIQDSFRRLSAEEGVGPHNGALLSDTLVHVVESRARGIAEAWLIEIREHPSTRTMAGLHGRWLRCETELALSRLSRRLRDDAPVGEVNEYYHHWGVELASRGCPLPEALSALSLLKRAIWVGARGSGLWERPVEAYRILEMFTVVGTFFDRAAYHVARGYDSVEGGQTQIQAWSE